MRLRHLVKKIISSIMTLAIMASIGTSVMAGEVMLRQAFTVCPTCRISPNVVRGSDVPTGSNYSDCLKNPARDDLMVYGYYPETTYCPNCGYSQSMNVSYTKRTCNH